MAVVARRHYGSLHHVAALSRKAAGVAPLRRSIMVSASASPAAAKIIVQGLNLEVTDAIKQQV